MIVWLSSYPKSGNTWVRAIISSLVYSEDGIFNFNMLRKIIIFIFTLFLGLDMKKNTSKNYITIQGARENNLNIEIVLISKVISAANRVLVLSIERNAFSISLILLNFLT